MASQPRPPKVAVITRTKNRSLFLKRALASAQRQTMQDFVQVVVNDGGDKKAVEQLVAHYPKDKVLLIHNDSSLGHSKALMRGIEAVDSTYIAVLDDDDSWDKDCLKLAVEGLEEKKAKGIVVTMDRVIEEVKDGKISRISQNRWLPDLECISLYKQCLDNYVSAGCFIYERAVYEEIGGYDNDLTVAEDWDFGIRFLMKYDVEVLKTDKPLVFYHHRPEAKGNEGNSVFAGVDEHTRYLNLLANKYLRQDIKAGKFGIGYIMNSLRYEREQMSRHVEREAQNVVRLEGHMNYVGEEIKKDIQSLQDQLMANRVRRRIDKLMKRDD